MRPSCRPWTPIFRFFLCALTSPTVIFRFFFRGVAKIGYTRSVSGHNRVHLLYTAGSAPLAPSDWPTTAPTRSWLNSRRVYPILATLPPEGYPILFSPTRKWPGYSTNTPLADHAHEHTSAAPRTRIPTLPTAGGRGPNPTTHRRRRNQPNPTTRRRRRNSLLKYICVCRSPASHQDHSSCNPPRPPVTRGLKDRPAAAEYER